MVMVVMTVVMVVLLVMVVDGGSSWERSTKYCACHEICASRSTQSTAPATISENEPHVPVTTSEHVED